MKLWLPINSSEKKLAFCYSRKVFICKFFFPRCPIGKFCPPSFSEINWKVMENHWIYVLGSWKHWPELKWITDLEAFRDLKDKNSCGKLIVSWKILWKITKMFLIIQASLINSMTITINYYPELGGVGQGVDPNFWLLLGRHFPRECENQLNKNSGKFVVFMSYHKLN